MKNEKQFWRSYFDTIPSKAPAECDHINFNLEERLEDMDMLWLTERLKSVRRLDLKETDITDKGIQYLSRLIDIRQLNLKGTYVTEKCIPHLLKMSNLEYLHFNEHPIPLKEIKNLKKLAKLTDLFFHVDESAEKHAIMELHAKWPKCKIHILNG
jgi:hypothetical protein